METRCKDQHCKIRKRGNSSSSSSSLVQKYRFKRAILVGKRGGGSTTPVPTWLTAAKSPSLPIPNVESAVCQSGGGVCGGERSKVKDVIVSVSARKLAATLWEINEVPSPSRGFKEEKKLSRDKHRVAKLPLLLDPSYAPASERMDRSRGNGHRRTSVVTKKLQLTDCNNVGECFDSSSNTSLIEIGTPGIGKGRTECTTGTKIRLKNVSNGLSTSKELVKVLQRIWGLDDQHSSAMSLVSDLRAELDRARVQVNQLIKEQWSQQDVIGYLVKQFEEEKAAWKIKERERIRKPIACIAEELEVEKKLRRQTERLNKKLGQELTDMKASFTSAIKELESEKRAKEILEQVCGELAKGIGEDRAEVEELKKESAKVKEEVEKEREMLQLADVLREERVQMKLSEAKYHFEEKNAALEKLKCELEAYLRKKVGGEGGDCSPDYEKIKELEAYLRETQIGSFQKAQRQEFREWDVANGEVHDGDDSADSELHSIELNMDNNKSYQWSYAREDGNKAQGIPTPDNATKGRKSTSKNTRKGLNSVDANHPNGLCKSPEVFDGEMLSGLGIHSQAEDLQFDIERYESVKTLRDHILSGSKRTVMQNFSSPTRHLGQSVPFQDLGNTAFEYTPALPGDGCKSRLVETRNGQRMSTSSRH